MPRWVAEAKKREEEKKAGAKKPQSSSVKNVNKKAQNSTFMGGGAPVKKAEKTYQNAKKPSAKAQRIADEAKRRRELEQRQNQKMYGDQKRATPRKTTSTSNNLTRHTTAAQRQKMGMPTAEDLRQGREHRRALANSVKDSVRRATSEENKSFMQRQKSGIQTEADRQYSEKLNQRRAEVAKNTGRAATKGVQDTLTGYGKTLADVDEMAKSNKNWTRAKASKMGISEDDTVGMAKVEGERQKSIKQAQELRRDLAEKQEKRQAEFDERTKNAKGLEKAWYGAVESGTGMATDALVGALTGTGTAGSLASMAVRTYGTTRGQAEKEGATENEDRAYAVLQAAKEVGTELLFPGAGLAKKTYGNVGLSVADRVANKLTKGLTGSNADLVGAGVRLLGGTAEENAEELAGWGLDPVIKELAYGKNVRTREAQNLLKQESDELRSNLKSAGDARSVAAYLGSDRFLADNIAQYKDAGLSDKQAREVAEKMRDYLTASLTGDTDRMGDLEDEIVTTVAGGSLKAMIKDYDVGELMDTFASTSVLTLATGLPATATTAMKGARIRENLGSEGLRALSQTAINFEDDEASLKGQAARDRLDSGKDLTSTQVFDLAKAQAEQIQKDEKRVAAMSNMADNAIKSEKLVTPKIGFRENGSVAGDEIITMNYVNESNNATEIISDLLKEEGSESLTDTEVQTGSRAIAGFKTGAFTVNDANALNYTNTTVRTAFEAATGVNLSQYVVRKNGQVDIPATNAATKDALFAMAADNFVKTAQAETANWMDSVKGDVVTQVTERMGAQGSLALQQALDDVDERDRSTYMMNANAADMMYQTARNMGTEWDSVKAEASRMFPDISETKLEAMYNAGLRDRADAANGAIGQQVRMGEAMALQNEPSEPKGKVFVDTTATPKGTVVRTFSEIANNLGVDIHLVDDLKTSTGGQANGQYVNGAIYINMNSDFESNIGYIFMHEVTHHLKQYAPEQFNELENLVREKWFGYNPEQMQNEIAKKIELYKKNGQTLSEEDALEEIIADAAHEFLNDGNFAKQVAEDNPSVAKAILDGIKSVLRKFRQIIALGYFDDETHMANLFSQLDILDEAEKLWLNAYTQAVQNKAAVAIDEWQDRANGKAKQSITTDKEDFVKGANLSKELRDWAKEMGLDKLSSQPVKGPVIVSVRDLRTAWYEKNGRTDEAKVINTALDKIGDSLTKLVGEYQYIDLGDALNAAVTYRTDAEGHPTSVILSCQVKNAEYEVNFDFTTICAKRLAMQKILERFIKTEGERQGTTLYDELKLDEEGLYKLRLILETAGFDVSCRGCFVEQNRYSQQNQARTIANDWNAALDEWAKDNGTEVTENFGLTTLDIDNLDYEEIEAGFERYHELMKGKKTDVATKNRMLIEASPFFRKRMNASDYASMAGQRALMAIGESKKSGTNLYGLLKRGQSDSKQSVPFTAYNGEISLLPDNMKGKSLYDYLLSIGGARAQSASDFQIEFVYDYMQMVADLSARGLPMHMYTKVIELAELFGMTGIKINLSAMCDVAEDLGGEYAGLKLVDGKYEYNISDQSIDYEKAVALQKKDGYSKNIGIIMVTLSSQHMLKSLDDPDVRYIIGYHSSAMPVVVANMSNMGGATDYTKINKTNKLNEKGKALFDAAMEEAKGNTELEKYKDALRIFDQKIQEETAKKKKLPRRGNEYGSYMSAYGGNTADFNTYDSLLETKDARKTADKYLEHCMKNDLIPIYFPFAFHENYYKCEIYDFNMYDNNTGEYAPMESVQNIYPGLNMAAGETDTTAFTERVSQMMGEQNRVNKSLDSQYDAVFDEAKNTLHYSITGDDYMDMDASGIDHSELTHRADATKTEAQMRDDAYMDAVNSGDMETAQRLVDEAAKRAGMRVAHRYHGTMNAGFTVFDKAYAKVGGNSGAGFYFSTDKDDSVNHYADVEGADNYFKWSSLAEHINDQINEGTWEGPELETYEDVEEYAKEQLNKNPGTYDVYLNYKNPYVRDYKNSTNIYDMLMDGFDESIIDRDDYEDEWEYEDAVWEAKAEHLADSLYSAVYGAYQDIENNYEVLDMPYIDEVISKITEYAFDGSLTWEEIQNGIVFAGEVEVTNPNWTDAGDATPEFTRAIIENLGFDAIEDKEVSNKFGQLSREMMTDTEHIIVFKPEQIKLSDPVTYAEDGSVIPLSERFDPTNNDIRYSLPTTDADGNVLTDGQMEYFKNSQARDGQGRLVPVYHTTNMGGFTIFDPSYSEDRRSIFFTDSEAISKTYGTKDSRTTYECYLNLENPLIVDADYNAWDRIPITRQVGNISLTEDYDTNEVSRIAFEAGYDGVIIRNCRDWAVDDSSEFDTTENSPYSTIYIAFSSNQVKDINNENPTENPDIRYSIPDEEETMNLAQDKAKTTDDVWATDPVTQEGRIRKKNGKQDFINGVINKWNPAWKTEGKVLKDSSVEKAVRDVIMGAMRESNTTAKYRQAMVKKTMLVARQAFNMMKNDEYAKAAELLYDHAYDMIENLEFFGNDDKSEFERYKELREYLRTTKITVPEDKRSDIDYASFRKKNFGKILLGDGGTAPNVAWQRLNELWPEAFTEDIKGDPASIMLQMENALDIYEPYTTAYSSEQCVEFAGDIADSLYDIIYEGEEYKSLADKYTDKSKAMKARHAEAMEKVKQNYKDRLNKQRLDAKRKEYARLEAQKERITNKYEERLSNVKDKYERKIRAQKRKADFEIATLKQNREYNIQRLKAEKARAVKEERQRGAYKRAESLAKQREKQMHRQLYNRVLKEYNDLTHRLLHPTKDKAKNIPEQLRQPLAQMLHCFDLEKERSKKLEEMYMIPTRSQLNFRELKDAFEKVIKEDPTAYELSDVHKYMADKMTELADRVDGKSIDALDIEDIKVVKDLLVGLNAGIKNAQQLEIDGENYQKQQMCDKVGEGAAEHQKLYGKAKKYGSNDRPGIRAYADHILNMGELTPIYFFRQIKGMYDMYRQMRKGFNTYVRNEKNIINKIADILSDYYKTNRKGERIQGSEIEEWRHSESAETFPLMIGNQTITLTIAQKMSLYCLAKRSQAQMHMYSENGGIVASETSAGSKIHQAEERYKGKTVEYKPVYLTPADVDAIISTLTEDQKTIADQLQKLMSTDMAELGNEASVKLTGIEMYKEQDYFPIKVMGESLPTNPENIGIREKIRNPGFSNPLQENASNPIIVDDIFAVVASHCNEMNQYASYAVPITNFMKVYNGSVINEEGKAVKIKTVLKETYGEKALTYIENFIDDINGNSFKRHGGIDDVLDKVLGQAKKAAVFANLRVALQQPTAIVRALAVMNPKYFMGVHPSTKATKEMIEHCPIAQWKALGYFDTHFGRDIEDVMMGRDVSSKGEQLMSEIYGQLDNMTWGMIWQAVKNEVKATHKGIDETSQEFWDLCEERASFVFDSTQVVDSPFHRSNDMRSKDRFVKQLTSFQAEPTLSFNVLRQGFVDAYEALKKGDSKKARRIVERVLGVWVAQALTVALAQSIVDALRRKGHKKKDDEEDEMLTWYQEFVKYFFRNFGNNFKDDLNPINNIYFVKDIVPPIMNAIKGEYVYGTQSLTTQWVDTLTNGISMCKKKWEKGDADSHTWYDCLTELFGGLGYLKGIPAKTMMRGTKNAFHWAGKIFGINVFADDGKAVDKAVDSFVDNFRGDESESEGGGLFDSIANKMGYRKSEESSGDTEESNTDSADIDAKLKDYEESLSDTYTDKQKKNLVKQYKKTLEKEAVTEAAMSEDFDVQAHIAEAQANFDYEMEKRSIKAAEMAAGKTGRQRDEALWDVIAEGYTKSVDSGNMATIQRMREEFAKQGGDTEWFDAKIADKMKSAYKKTLYSSDEIVPGASLRQETMYNFMTEHGVSETEISDIVYHSYVARDLKAAMRIGNEDYIMDELVPLVAAGLSREDYEKLYKYRNMGAKTYDGKYTDPKYTKTTGTFVWPTEGVITSHFGWRNAPTAGASSNHPAIDIGAPSGTTVVAADGGVVITAGANGGYGNSVGIKHANGMVTYYNHLSAWNVKVGDQVAQGQPIANVGSTGISTGPHLDFKILDADGNPVDPEKYLNKRS